jgi:hypothetical protein
MDKSGSIGNFTPNFLFVKALTDQFKSERTRFAIVLFDEYAQSSSIPYVYLIIFLFVVRLSQVRPSRWLPDHFIVQSRSPCFSSLPSHSKPDELLQLTGDRAKIRAAVETLRTTKSGGNTYFAPAFQIVSDRLVDSTAIAAIFFVTGARSHGPLCRNSCLACCCVS